MLWKRIKRFWKSGFFAISTLVCVSGCNQMEKAESAAPEPASELQMMQKDGNEESEDIINICLPIYDNAPGGELEIDLETIRRIVNELGKNGYVAVDSKNQINMTNAKLAVRFCEMTEDKEDAELTVLEFGYQWGFAKYDLQANEGKIDVVRSYYKYENGKIQRKDIASYQAEHWNYTKDGYLMFSGIWFSEQQYVLTLSDAEEYTAWRINPLDETCRELNRKYLLPIGYERNNMFMTDWSEEDFGALNFYDMYDIFYPQITGEQVPYSADENLGVGAVYHIPREEFESIIMTYFNIDRKTLQSKTIYEPEDCTYEYKPRGFYEVEYPEYPYPEVVGFTENEDGTITLTVHVVFPYKGDSSVYTHEVVVRLLEEEGIQYVSNRIIPSEDNGEETWHMPRLTQEAWEEIYGDT